MSPRRLEAIRGPRRSCQTLQHIQGGEWTAGTTSLLYCPWGALFTGFCSQLAQTDTSNLDSLLNKSHDGVGTYSPNDIVATQLFG